ncbi:MAG: hypothetical protein M3071_15525 [Actinomycetota bacterium]|nr:hypothetical protein [Actinomycetota bacterium]
MAIVITGRTRLASPSGKPQTRTISRVFWIKAAGGGAGAGFATAGVNSSEEPPAVAEAQRAPEAPEAPIAAKPPRAPRSPLDPEAVLVGVLDKLGAAHHRPFSRA